MDRQHKANPYVDEPYAVAPASAARYEDSVVVAGAGPTGLACALTLARYGVRCVLVDQGTGTARPGSRSIGLDTATLAYVHDLAGDRLDGAAEPWDTTRVRRRNSEVPNPAPGAPRYGLSQARLENALLSAVRSHPLITTAWQHTLAEVEQDGRTVTVTATGPAGPVRWQASFLVGCDGRRSPVRKAADIRFPGRPRVDRLLCADVLVRGLGAILPRNGVPFAPRLFVDPPFHRGGTVHVQPLPDDVWRFSWQLPLAHGFAKASDETQVIRIGDPADPQKTASRIRGVLRALTGSDFPYDLQWTGEWEVHQRLARSFGKGRILIAGDAAHLVHPSAADGVELGLHDVRNLAWKLAFALHGQAPIRLLKTYDLERRAIAKRKLALGEEALHFLTPRTPVQKVGRGLTLLGTRSKGTTLRRLDPRGAAGEGSGPEYGASPVLRPGPGVGSPAADVPVVRTSNTEAKWLSECLDQSFLVMLTAPGIEVWDADRWRTKGLMPGLRRRLDDLPVPVELIATAEYPGLPPHTVLLIRPDGYLAAVLPPGEHEDLEAAVNTARGAGS